MPVQLFIAYLCCLIIFQLDKTMKHERESQCHLIFCWLCALKIWVFYVVLFKVHCYTNEKKISFIEFHCSDRSVHDDSFVTCAVSIKRHTCAQRNFQLALNPITLFHFFSNSELWYGLSKFDVSQRKLRTAI